MYVENQPMIRIAIISQYFMPEIGAPQNRLYELATGLKQNGFEISVITAMPNYPNGKIERAYRGRFFIREYMEDIAIRRYWLFASNSKRTIPRILNMLSFSFNVLFEAWYLCRKRFDYLLIESPPLTLGLSGLILSKISGSRLILNISDLWPLTAKELGVLSEGNFYRFLENLESFLYRRSFICMGQSQEIVDYLDLHGARRSYLFRNGVDPRRFSLKRITPKTVRIVYTGILGVAQGILAICININFSKLGVEFHIYGSGNERESLERFLNLNPDRGIFYHGSITREEIPRVLNQYSATLIALVKNIYGAVPSKIYESMAAGLPIIFSGEGEGRSIIEQYNLGWTSPAGDYQQLRKNIRMICAEEKQMEQKKQNCIYAANELFNRPKQVEKLSHYLHHFLQN
jgi:glycosyltransferase involved in cell wall biosynthesis